MSLLEECLLTNRVRVWNGETFGNIFHRRKKKKVLAQLRGTQTALCSNPSPFLLRLEKELIIEFNHILKLEEDFWVLKSRTEWQILKDRNTSFFHISTICRRHQNKIWCLKDAMGNWTYSLTNIENSIQSHFTSLYTTNLTHSTHTIPFPNIHVPSSTLKTRFPTISQHRKFMPQLAPLNPTKPLDLMVFTPFPSKNFGILLATLLPLSSEASSLPRMSPLT